MRSFEMNGLSHMSDVKSFRLNSALMNGLESKYLLGEYIRIFRWALLIGSSKVVLLVNGLRSKFRFWFQELLELG